MEVNRKERAANFVKHLYLSALHQKSGRRLDEVDSHDMTKVWRFLLQSEDERMELSERTLNTNQSRHKSIVEVLSSRFF